MPATERVLRMARFLVTGGCGFIGSHLVEALQWVGHHVVVVDDLSTGLVENVPTATGLIVADVAESAQWLGRVGHLDGIFHLAAVASVERCNRDWVDSHRTNLTGTLAIFEAARSMSSKPPVVYASSAAVYGNQDTWPITEDSPTVPLSPYGVDKLACEMHAAVAGSLFGLSSAGMRFFNVYGPRQDPRSPYSGVISIFLDRVVNGGPVAIYGDGGAIRDFVYVGDVVEVMMRAMALLGRSPGSGARVMNVCTGRATRIDRLFELICELSGQYRTADREAPRRGEIRASIGSPAMLVGMLGAACETRLEDGLRKTIDSIRAGAPGTMLQSGKGLLPG